MSVWALLHQNQGNNSPQDWTNLGIQSNQQTDGSVSPDDITLPVCWINTSAPINFADFSKTTLVLKKYGCLVNMDIQATTIQSMNNLNGWFQLYNFNGILPTTPYTLPDDAVPLITTVNLPVYPNPIQGENIMTYPVPTILNHNLPVEIMILGGIFILWNTTTQKATIYFKNITNFNASQGGQGYQFLPNMLPIHTVGCMSLTWNTDK